MSWRFIRSSAEALDFGDLDAFDQNLTELSIAAWVRMAGVANDGTIISKRDNAGAQVGFDLFFDTSVTSPARNDTFTFAVDEGTDTTAIFGDTDVGLINTWHHVVATFRGAVSNGLNLWVDGKLQSDSPVSTTAVANLGSSTTPVLLGKLSSSTARDMNGEVAEVGVWTRVLAEPEAVALYRRRLRPSAIPRGLLFHFDGQTGSSIERTRLTYPTKTNTPEFYPHGRPPSLFMGDFRRRGFVAAAPGGGLSIPVAMHNYRRRRAA